MKKILGSTGKWIDIFLFVGFVNIFLFHKLGAMALSMVMLGIWGLCALMFGRGSNTKVKIWSLLAVSVIAGVTIVVGSPEKIAMMFGLFAGMIITTSYVMLKRGMIGGLFELILAPLNMVKEYFFAGVGMLIDILSGKIENILTLGRAKQVSKLNGMKSLLTGLVLGTPLIILLVMTLVQADPIFAKYIEGLVKPEIWQNWGPRIFISSFVFVITMPLLFMQFRGYRSPIAFMANVSWGKEMNVISSMVAAVMALFLIIQWPYVFASVAKETDLTRFGIATYSEYVQRGFGDLLKVAGMMFGVAWAGFVLAKNSLGVVRKYHVGIQALLGVEFVIFIFSMFRRVWLYQNYHGLSLARLYGLVTLIFIVGMTITMIMRYFYPKFAWVRVEMAWIMVVVLGTTLINLEKYVVKVPPTVNNRIDYVYLSRLPNDGYSGWVMAYDWAHATLSKQNEQFEILNKDARRDAYYSGVIAWNLSKNYHKLVMRYGTDEEVKNYVKRALDVKSELIELVGLGTVEKALELKQLDKARTQLESNDWLKKVDLNMYYLDSGKMYHWVSEGEEFERNLGIDKLLGFSASDAKTYKQLKTEIGIEKLLELQKLDLMLKKRVAAQPSSEREFEIDISMNGPFLR